MLGRPEKLKLPFQESSGTLVKHEEIGISEYPGAQKQRDCAQLESCMAQALSLPSPAQGHQPGEAPRSPGAQEGLAEPLELFGNKAQLQAALSTCQPSERRCFIDRCPE